MSVEGKYYRAPLGGGTIAASIISGVIIFVCGLPVLLIHPLLGVFFYIAIGLILFFCLFTIPKGYYLDENGIVISRRTSNISIPYEDLFDIDYLGRKMMYSYFSIGLRGWFGWSCTSYYGRYGWVKVYSRRLIKMVLISTGSGKKYAIAPEYPEDFIREVELFMKAMGMGNREIDDEIDDGNGFAPVIEENGFAEVVDY